MALAAAIDPRRTQEIKTQARLEAFETGFFRPKLNLKYLTIMNNMEDSFGYGFFFNDYAGVELCASWLDGESVINSFDASGVLRDPVPSGLQIPLVGKTVQSFDADREA